MVTVLCVLYKDTRQFNLWCQSVSLYHTYIFDTKEKTNFVCWLNTYRLGLFVWVYIQMNTNTVCTCVECSVGVSV